jgi:hypothetical protein
MLAAKSTSGVRISRAVTDMPSNVVFECNCSDRARHEWRGRGYGAFNGYIIPCTVPAGTWHIAAWRGRTCDRSHDIPIVDGPDKAAVHNTAASRDAK